MLDASRSWKRNTWWLFDRLVESPHLTSFYARKNDGVDTDESWQEAAQFWYVLSCTTGHVEANGGVCLFAIKV